MAAVFLLTSCIREQPEIIVVTATFPDQPAVVQPADPEQSAPAATYPVPPEQPRPTPNPTRPVVQIPDEHVVQPGDTLTGIAQRYNVSVETLLAVNELENPNLLSVGQTIQLPAVPTEQTPDFKILPDSRLVRSPSASGFDIDAFIAAQPGFIRGVTDEVTTRLANGAGVDRTLTAAEIVDRVSWEYSVDPRLLLAILELRAGWLTDPQPPEELREYPLVTEADSAGFDRAGLYRQLAWAANELNRGYYGWKYRALTALMLEDGTRLQFAPGLNPATIGVQYLLSLNNNVLDWQQEVSSPGLYRVYYALFGDPFADDLDPLIPAAIQQPQLSLPFAPSENWRYTGGPHGGWGSGSGWAALDFAPPDERPPDASFCYTSTSWVTAVADGTIARSQDGVVVLDLDQDGDETTGWTILYLHLAEQDRVPAGAVVRAGDRIGYASCAGGFSTATHLHIARRYNGEWMPADCTSCTDHQVPGFTMSGWRAVGIVGQEYQGFLMRDSERVQAEQGRLTDVNVVSW